MDIIEPTAKTVDELKKLNLPAGRGHHHQDLTPYASAF